MWVAAGARWEFPSRDLRQCGLYVVDGDGFGARKGGGDQCVVAEVVDLARQALGCLEDGLRGGGFEEGQLGTGQAQAVSDVGGRFVAAEGREAGAHDDGL